MRILLITFNAFLEQAVTQVLNPDNDYCAIVVDEVEPARKFLSRGNYPAERVFPLYEMEECIKNFYYDCLICLTWENQKLPDEIFRRGASKDKFIFLSPFNSEFNFFLDRALRYYEKNFAQFEMFATGASLVELGLVPKLFTKKLFNFAISSQDLYFDYQIAKKIISIGGGF